MKDDQKKWWNSWAPYWEHLEDRHLSVFETEWILESLVEPVLVVGAGQGLVIEHLNKKGFRADGIDTERQMVLFANRRRSLAILQADARDMPIKSATYNTVIIATGVVDYIADDHLVQEIIAECQRVLAPAGNLLISFYQLLPKIERIYRNIGVLTSDNWYRIKRIFELFKTLKIGPLACIKLIRKWTDRSYLSSFIYWTKLGATLPKELKNEQKTMNEIVEVAGRDGITKEELFKNTPDYIPYRKEGEIEAIMHLAKLASFELCSSDECIIVKCLQAGLKMEK
jgi:SAM-dependent methyltransferase